MVMRALYRRGVRVVKGTVLPRPSRGRATVRRGQTAVMLALSRVLVMLAKRARVNELLGMMATMSRMFLAAPRLLMVIVGISRVVGSRLPSQP